MKLNSICIYSLILIFGNTFLSVLHCHPSLIFKQEILKRPSRFDQENWINEQEENEVLKTRKHTWEPASRAGLNNTCSHVRRPPRGLRSYYRLPKYSLKYTESYNIPIIASQRVADQALKRACYVLRFLLADRQDLREAVFRRNVVVVVAGVSENMEELHGGPFAKSHDRQSRYIVATRDRPIVVGAEENLLCSNIHTKELDDTFLKALAMSIANVAMSDVLPSFWRILNQAFDDSKASGWWDGPFAEDSLTYFGEGAQSFYNVNNYGQMNQVMDRVRLASHDSMLFRILINVFPCADVYYKRCNSKGHEDLYNVDTDCPISFGYKL